MFREQGQQIFGSTDVAMHELHTRPRQPGQVQLCATAMQIIQGNDPYIRELLGEGKSQGGANKARTARNQHAFIHGEC